MRIMDIHLIEAIQEATRADHRQDREDRRQEDQDLGIMITEDHMAEVHIDKKVQSIFLRRYTIAVKCYGFFCTVREVRTHLTIHMKEGPFPLNHGLYFRIFVFL